MSESVAPIRAEIASARAEVAEVRAMHRALMVEFVRIVAEAADIKDARVTLARVLGIYVPAGNERHLKLVE